MGGKERELKSCSWKNERRKERKEGGREEERRKESKETGKGAGRGKAELPEPERLTQDSRAQDTWPCLPHPLCCLHMAPLPWTGGGPLLGAAARLQDFASLFLILLCRISLLVVDFLLQERHSTQHPGGNGASDLSLGGDALGGQGRRQCPQVRLKTEKKKRRETQLRNVGAFQQ